MFGKLEIINAVVLDEVQGVTVQHSDTDTAQLMLQIQYEEGNGRTFLNGQLIIKVPIAVAQKIKHNRAIIEEDMLEIIRPYAIHSIYNKLTQGDVYDDECHNIALDYEHILEPVATSDEGSVQKENDENE